MEPFLDDPPRCAHVLAFFSDLLGRRAAFISVRFQLRTGLDLVVVFHAAQFRRVALCLHDSDDKIEVIAKAEKFSDGTALWRAFRREYGVSPSDFRMWAREELRMAILGGRTPSGARPAPGGASI